MKYKGQEIVALSDESLLDARTDLIEMAKFAVEQKAKYKPGTIKIQPPTDINPNFIALQNAISEEIKARGLNNGND